MDKIQPVNNKIVDLREATFALEKGLRQFSKTTVEEFKESGMPGQIEIPVKHYFSFGVYAREIYIPKDAVFTGEIHKYANLNILSKGELFVSIDGKIERIKAPYTFVAPAGSKRVFWAIEECVWTTIHGTHETNVDEIEKVFIAKTEEEFLEFVGANQLTLGLKND